MPLFPGQLGGRDEFARPSKPSDPTPKDPYRLAEITDQAAQEVGFSSAESLRQAVQRIELTSDQVRYVAQELVNLDQWLDSPTVPSAVEDAKRSARHIIEK